MNSISWEQRSLTLGADGVDQELAIQKMIALLLRRLAANLQDRVTFKLDRLITLNTN